MRQRVRPDGCVVRPLVQRVAALSPSVGATTCQRALDRRIHRERLIDVSRVDRWARVEAHRLALLHEYAVDHRGVDVYVEIQRRPRYTAGDGRVPE